MERVTEKLERWNKIKEISEKRKISLEQRANHYRTAEKKKFDKNEQNYKEHLEDVKAKLDYQK